MLKKHHTITYVYNKLLIKMFEVRNPNLPWLTQQAIELLNQLIIPSDTGLEFGSGRSTKWLAKKCKRLISIENNEFWYNKVKVELSAVTNVEYYFKSSAGEEPSKTPYVSIFDSIQDNSIDFILNDGKLRDVVALKSVQKLKAGGVYILDNAERYVPNSFKIPESIGPEKTSHKNWNEFLDQTTGWRRIWTTNGVTSTLILFKP